MVRWLTRNYSGYYTKTRVLEFWSKTLSSVTQLLCNRKFLQPVPGQSTSSHIYWQPLPSTSPGKFPQIAWERHHLVYFKSMEMSCAHFSLAYLQSQGQSAEPHPAPGGGDFCSLKPEWSWRPWSHSWSQTALAHSLRWPQPRQMADNLGPGHSGACEPKT